MWICGVGSDSWPSLLSENERGGSADVLYFQLKGVSAGELESAGAL
jgi:hypothetical protein